jgi:hypothetical protein
MWSSSDETTAAGAKQTLAHISNDSYSGRGHLAAAHAKCSVKERRREGGGVRTVELVSRQQSPWTAASFSTVTEPQKQ